MEGAGPESARHFRPERRMSGETNAAWAGGQWRSPQPP